MARHSDANAAAAASSSSAAAQGPVVNGIGGSAAVVTPVMEARFKLEQVMSAIQQKKLMPIFVLTMVMQKHGETMPFCCMYMVHGLMLVVTAASRSCETCRCDTLSVLEQQSCKLGCR